MSIVGLIWKIQIAYQLEIVITSPYWKLTGAVLTSKTTALHIVTIFLRNCVVPNGISNHVLTEKGTKFIRTVLRTLCDFLKTKPLKMEVYYAKSNALAERFKTIILRL